MTSPLKTSTSSSAVPTRKTLNSTLPFSLRRSSPNVRSENADLQRKLEDVTVDFQEKSHEAEEARARAEVAEEKLEALKEIGKKFWKEEWSGMRDFMMAFSSEEHVKEIEDRILAEYRELFKDGD